VFHDAENFNVKHPLMHTWTLWFTKPPSGKVCIPLRSLG
jgi:translation initiation factor 4E